MTDRQRRLSAIMFTDIVSFTSLGQKNEERALRLLEEFRRLVRPVFLQFGGNVVKTMGDGFLVEFASAVEAVRCAVAVQQNLHDRSATVAPEDAVQIRVGLHVGDVVHSDDDVFGDAVNVASRIEPLAEPGGVCLTERVFQDVHNKVDCLMVSLGKQNLRNVEAPMEVFRLLLPWAKDFPQPNLLLQKRRIVVLPLRNMGGDSADDYFADGMTEELIATLSSIAGLKVISRTSAMKYKETQKGIPEIARELGVGTIIEGSVRKAGNRVRITVQLIDSESDEHLWTEQYDREVKDVLAIQTDIATHAAEALQVRLFPTEVGRTAIPHPIDPEVHGLYLKGRFSANKRTEEGLHRGIAYFRQALERDPAYALAYAGLAESYIPLVVYCYIAPNDGMPKAKAAAEKALEIQPSLVEARTAIAMARFMYDWDFPGALGGFRAILEANPNYPRARQALSECLISLCRFTEARAELKQALDLDPLSMPINTGVAMALYNQRQYDSTVEVCTSIMEIDSNFFPARMYNGLAHARLGEFPKAISELEEARALSHGSGYILGALGEAYGLAGRRAEAEVVLRELQEMGTRRYVSQVSVAGILLSIGEVDRAWEILEKAAEDRCPLLRFLTCNPVFDVLRPDPRFRKLLDRLGLGEVLPPSRGPGSEARSS